MKNILMEIKIEDQLVCQGNDETISTKKLFLRGITMSFLRKKHYNAHLGGVFAT